ncbi:HAMP domain-containing protein [Actinokineospora sp.]|uniref:HAMP domain-containing protein n=1 Tax=Actinokineospora sp. TaxID=1872133 RepID=UPI0040382AAE
MRNRIDQGKVRPTGRLESQLPESGFPAGVGIPSMSLLVLLLALAGLTAVLLDGRAEGTVPRAFVESQERLAADTARGIGVSANQSLNDLRTAAAGPAAAQPDALLDTLVKNRKWRGVAVFSGRALVATRGEQVPVPASVSDSAVSSVIAANGEPHLVTAIALPGGRVLVATSTVRLPEAGADDGLRQSLLLTTTAGQVVGASRSSPVADAAEVAGLVSVAGQSAPGSRLGPTADGLQATVAAVRVSPSGQPTALDLVVVTVGYGPAGVSAAGGAGIVPAAALAVVAVFGFLVVRVLLVRPVRRLRADVLKVASGNLRTKVRRSSVREVARIAAAARYCRRTLLRVEPERAGARGGVPVLVAVVLATVTVLGWSASVVLLAGEAQVPGAVVTSVRNQTARATEALRRSMNDGLADLAVVAASAGPEALAPALDQLVAGQPRYRSVYLVDGAGAAGEYAGRAPLRVAEVPPAKAGVRQQNSAGRVPVLFAHVPLAGTDRTLVGEFDLDHLADLLGQAPGKVRLVDAEFRTISATGGYVAFEELTAEGPRRGVTQARGGVAVAETGATAIVAAAPVAGGEIGRLGWTVVAEQPIADLALPANDLRRNATLVALVAALLAVLGFGWHLFVVVSPLRRVARAAGRIVAGDRDSVIYPQRHDEIGTIASCLEVCRQALTQGAGRLGEARRPRGGATDETTLMSRIAEEPRPAPHPTPARRPAARAAPRRPKIGQGSA